VSGTTTSPVPVCVLDQTKCAVTVAIFVEVVVVSSHAQRRFVQVTQETSYGDVILWDVDTMVHPEVAARMQAPM